MKEGSGSESGSISLTNGSGSGRPKNMWIRIRNTDHSCCCCCWCCFRHCSCWQGRPRSWSPGAVAAYPKRPVLKDKATKNYYNEIPRRPVLKDKAGKNYHQEISRRPVLKDKAIKNYYHEILCKSLGPIHFSAFQSWKVLDLFTVLALIQSWKGKFLIEPIFLSPTNLYWEFFSFRFH